MIIMGVVFLLVTKQIHKIESDKIELFIGLLLLIFITINIPRLFNFLSYKFDNQFKQNSKISNYINSIDFISENNWLKKYYLIMFGNIEKNNSIWLFKISTFYGLIVFAALSLQNIILKYLNESNNLIILGILSIFILIPIIFISIHLIKVNSKKLFIKIPIYGITFILLIISSYLGLLLTIISFMIRITPIIFIKVLTNKKAFKKM